MHFTIILNRKFKNVSSRWLFENDFYILYVQPLIITHSHVTKRSIKTKTTLHHGWRTRKTIAKEMKNINVDSTGQLKNLWDKAVNFDRRKIIKIQDFAKIFEFLTQISASIAIQRNDEIRRLCRGTMRIRMTAGAYVRGLIKTNCYLLILSFTCAIYLGKAVVS